MGSGFKNHAQIEGHEINNEEIYNSSVGCVTCFYNEENIVEDTLDNLDSALEDSESIETWYLVDDGSTDSTPDILHEYAEDSEVVEFIEMEENTGKFGAQKHATEQMTEEYWLSIDADSYIDNPEDLDDFVTEFGYSDAAATMLNIRPETSEKEDDEGLISKYISSALESMQELEYNMRFGISDYTSNMDDSKIITASGTATFGETDKILDAMDEHTGEYAGDDRQLTSILQLKHDEEVDYNDSITIGTDCPDNLKDLGHQRNTWANGRINAVAALPEEHWQGLKEGDRYSVALGADLGMTAATPIFAYGGLEAAATGNVETMALGYGTGLGLTTALYLNGHARDQIGEKTDTIKDISKDTPKLATMPIYQSGVAIPTILNSFKEKFVQEPVNAFKEGYQEGKQ